VDFGPILDALASASEHRDVGYEETIRLLDETSERAADWHPLPCDDYGLSRIDEATRFGPPYPNPILNVLWPSLHRTYVLFANLMASIEGTTLASAICNHRYNHGHWPESLSALAEATDLGVKESSSTHPGFIYRLIDGWPLLYLVGEDGVDNGGCLKGAVCSDSTDASMFDWIMLAPPGWYSRFTFIDSKPAAGMNP
jgi:hypothetical protein